MMLHHYLGYAIDAARNKQKMWHIIRIIRIIGRRMVEQGGWVSKMSIRLGDGFREELNFRQTAASR